MATHHRHRPRHTRPVLTLEHGSETCRVWLPDPDQPLVLAHFGDAAALAVATLEMPVDREVLVLLDQHRAVTAMLLDPPAELGVGIGWCDGPGLEVPFTHTLDIVIRPKVPIAPPSDHDIRGYRSLRRLHMLQGLTLLDVVLVDGDRVQSIAIGAGIECEWFDEHDGGDGDDPLEPAA